MQHFYDIFKACRVLSNLNVLVF
uniref:Uncharacterized protein n=1 Tax=Anguilla anguilla TaxID=7936 RepID=A0A0E9XBY7_ANGAN